MTAVRRLIAEIRAAFFLPLSLSAERRRQELSPR